MAWAATVGVFVAGTVLLPFQPFPYVFPTQAIRVMLLTGAALVAGAVAVAVATMRSSTVRTSPPERSLSGDG